MNEFFKIYTHTPWDNLKSDQLVEVKLMSLKSIFKNFPVIEKEFFEDLLSNVYKQGHYSYIQSLKRIIGPTNEDYDIASWIFLWAIDSQKRMYQFLFQKTKIQDKPSQSVLAALAPPELGKLISEHEKDAIHRIFTLLNTPKKIQFLMILAPKGKSIAEESQFYEIDQDKIDKFKRAQIMGNMPNIQGQWFPNFSPKCPICNELLVGLENYRISGGKIICPRCGYQKSNKTPNFF
ncbi:MAG: hypothetical protein ACFFBP_11170 [Promethearchaeota archaeon]